MHRLPQIQATLYALARRERWVLALLACLGAVALWLLAWACVSGMAALGTGLVWGLGSVAVAALVGVAGLWKVKGRWRATGDLRRQAVLVEARDPSLRARLLALSERLDGPRPQESESIQAWMAERVSERIQDVDAGSIHPLLQLRLPLFLVTAGVLALGALDAWTFPGPLGLWDWFRAPAAQAEPTGVEEAMEPLETLVGELVLRYDYPEYTGISSMVVPNSNGLAHGPPGTRVTVTARTGEVFEEASLQVLEDLPTRMTLSEDGRGIEGSFVLSLPGVYRFLLATGGEESRSPDYPIEIEPDLAPTVELETTDDRMEVQWDQPLGIGWSARDDFGVDRVEVIVDGSNGFDLRDPLETPNTLRDVLQKTPNDLGLNPGDEARITLQAWDNDQVGGSKAGLSREIRVVVLGPQGMARRKLRLWKELRDALVDLLADFVTDPDPPATRQNTLVAWGAHAASRFDPVDVLVDKYWEHFQQGTVEGLIVEEIRRSGGGMLRFVQSVADPHLEDTVRHEDLETLTDLRDELVDHSETAILMLDKLVRYRAMGDMNRLAQELAEAGTRLEERAEAGAPSREILGQLETLARLSDRLGDAARDYDGRLTDFVERTLQEAGRLDLRIRERVTAEDVEGTNHRISQLAEVLNQLAAGIEHQQRQAEAEDEQMAEMLEELRERLQELEVEERAHQLATREAREELGGDQNELLSQWELADQLATRAAEALERAANLAVEEKGFSNYESQVVDQAQGQTRRVVQVVAGRDIEGARTEVSRSQLRIHQSGNTVERMEARRSQWGEDNPLSRELERALRDASRDTTALEGVLDQLDRGLNQSSPELAQRSQELVEGQQITIGETRETSGTATEVAGQLPMGAPGLEEGMEGALREMGRAELALGQGRAVEAEGAQEAAADRLRQAREALDQAAQAMEQMRQAMQNGGEGRGRRRGGQDQDGDLRSARSVEIPPPEEFRTPEEYRQALIEGMQAEVPPEFDTLKRRYFEELVRQ